MGGVEIVFLDVETTIPYKKGQKFEILEFGAIVLCAQGLVEKTSFCTYVQPSSMAAISKKSVDCNGITKNDAAHAPFFSQIADHVYNLLDGRVWAGHNILSFDIPRIQEAFAEAGLQAPTAAGVIDTLPLLKSTFGCRAGNMKMASLASYCGLGEQAHRSLEDVRMNIQILKSCATILFLPYSSSNLEGSEEWSVARCCTRHTLNSNTKCMSGVGEFSNSSIGQIEGENPWLQVKEMSGAVESSDAGVGQIQYEPYASWLQVKDINESQVCVVKGPSSWGKKIPVVMYRGSPLCVYECDAMVRFSVREAYAFDQMRKPSFSLVLQPSQHTYNFFHALDVSVKSKYMDLGGQSQWRPLVWREGEADVIRIRIVTTGTGASATYTTQFHQRTEGRLRRTLTLGSVDPVVFRRWMPPGSRVDVLLASKVYDIQSTAGLQLIAHDLTLH
ncbi:unnamed protein product [Sphagnum tenellum]